MSNEIRVEFCTQRRQDIPTVGVAKKVRINGRPERKYVKRVDVEAVREYAFGLWYRGHYVLTDAAGLW